MEAVFNLVALPFTKTAQFLSASHVLRTVINAVTPALVLHARLDILLTRTEDALLLAQASNTTTEHARHALLPFPIAKLV